jgi:hypothetical protein
MALKFMVKSVPIWPEAPIMRTVSLFIYVSLSEILKSQIYDFDTQN